MGPRALAVLSITVSLVSAAGCRTGPAAPTTAVSTPAPATPAPPSPSPPPVIELPTGAAVLLVVDRSGSMQGAKIEAARAAARAALEAMPDGAAFGVITFDLAPHDALPLAAITDRAAARAAIDGIDTDGGTDLVAALHLAHTRLIAAPGPGRHIVLLSDGESSYEGAEELALRFLGDGITVSAVAIGSADTNLLRIFTDTTRARLYADESLDALPGIYVREVELALAAR